MKRFRHHRREDTHRNHRHNVELITEIMRDINDLDKSLYGGYPRQRHYAKTCNWFARMGRKIYIAPTPLPF